MPLPDRRCFGLLTATDDLWRQISSNTFLRMGPYLGWPDVALDTQFITAALLAAICSLAAFRTRTRVMTITILVTFAIHAASGLVLQGWQFHAAAEGCCRCI